MTIYRLDKRPELISLLASWYHKEWGESGGLCERKSLRNRLTVLANSRTIPFSLVAFDKDIPVATASVVLDERHAQPWLTNVLVPRAYRGQGYGRYVVEQATRLVCQFAFSRLYLLTSDRVGFFSRLGWKAIRTSQYGPAMVLMEKQLPPITHPADMAKTSQYRQPTLRYHRRICLKKVYALE